MRRSSKLSNTADGSRIPSLRCLAKTICPGVVWLLILLAGCTTASTSSQPFDQPLRFVRRQLTPVQLTPDGTEQLKLGLLLSLSGNSMKYGASMQDTARLLVDTVNGCNGVANQAVQLLSEDDQSSAAVGKSAMNRLAHDARVGAVIGAIGSEISNATVDIAVRNQVVQISPASASPVLTERAQKGAFRGFWFRTMSPDTFQGEALAQLAHQRGFQTVSILAIDNDYGKSIARSFETAFKKMGGTINGTPERYSPDATLYNVDFYTPFSGKPDAVLLVSDPTLGSAILKTAYESSLWSGSTKVLLPSNMKTETLAGRIGQSIDGRYIASGVLGIAPRANSAALNQFREIYQKKFNRSPNLYDPNAWDALAVAALAAEAAKGTTGAEIKTKILTVANPPGIGVSDVCQALSFVREGKEIDYQGASGTVDFSAEGDVVGNYDVWTIDYTGQIKVESSIQTGKAALPAASSVQ